MAVISLGDLSDFHFCFNVVLLFLITNHLLSSREQSQAYFRVFDDALQNRIMMCLQMILPNHHLSLSYNINEVYEAAKWVLQGTSRMIGLPFTVPPPLSAPALTAMKIMP